MLLERLGGGSMGTVYRARDLFLGRSVALKVHRRRPNEQSLRRFLQEARAAQALAHPNLAGTYDAGSEGDSYYLAMEPVSGTSLTQLLRSGVLESAEAVAIARQIAAGVAYAHQHGVMHRDLKPSNVMIRRDGVVKLVDFGLAKRIEASLPEDGKTLVEWSSVHTSPGAVLGTPAYMAPEQAAGKPVDARADVFALGLLLWEMIVGEPLYRRATPAATLRAVLSDPAPRLDVVAEGTPRWVADLVARCLAKDPLERFADAAQLRDALEAGRANDPSSGAVDLPALVERAVGPRLSASLPPPVPGSAPSVLRAITRSGTFVGRASDLETLDRWLASGAPLVAITGAAGLGKTRLAAELALRETDEPVVWVELAGVSRVSELLHALAFALGLSERDAELERIVRRLKELSARGGRTLVVLDGFEQLVPSGLAVLERCLAKRGRTQWIVTSRLPVQCHAAACETLALRGLALEDAIELFAEHQKRLRGVRDEDPFLAPSPSASFSVPPIVAASAPPSPPHPATLPQGSPAVASSGAPSRAGVTLPQGGPATSALARPSARDGRAERAPGTLSSRSSQSLRRVSLGPTYVPPADPLSDAPLRALEPLVQKLDGNPLALALTAARVAEDGLEVVLGQMARSTRGFEVDETATTGPLRAALDASLQLLSPVEQHLVVSLAVFASFDARAVEALLEAPRERNLAGQLERLASHGLLQRTPHPELLSVPRFHLLPAVRAYAESELTLRGDRETLETRHAAFYAADAARWVEALRTDPGRESWRELLAERENLFLVGRRALTYRSELWIGMGLRTLSAYATAVGTRSGDRAHVPILAKLLALGEERDAPNGAVHAEALLAHAEAVLARDEARATTDLARALEVATRAASASVRARVLALRAELHVRGGRTDAALDDARQASLVAERLKSPAELSGALGALVQANALAGDLVEAERTLALAEQVATRREDPLADTRVAMLRGDLLLQRGELVLATRSYERALDLAYGTGHVRLQSVLALRLAELAHRASQPEEARARYAAAALRARETNDPRIHARVMLGMGALELDEHRFPRAMELFREAQRAFSVLGELRGEAFARGGVSATFASTGDLESAVVELQEAFALVVSEPASQRVVVVWGGFLDLATDPGEEGMSAARRRLASLPVPGARVVLAPLVREAQDLARVVLERRLKDLELVH